MEATLDNIFKFESVLDTRSEAIQCSVCGNTYESDVMSSFCTGEPVCEFCLDHGSKHNECREEEDV